MFLINETYKLFLYLCFLESEDLAEDETCDTHVIEQTDKGFRCAIDVPSILYKWVIYKIHTFLTGLYLP